jgi:hypothetical protein
MMGLIAGTKLGCYEVRSKIGEGEMGEVPGAGTKLDRTVALKILPAEVADQSSERRAHL